MSCSDPKQDTVPSGLLQWTCRGRVRGTTLTGVLDGDDKGVVQILAQVPSATDTQTSRETFADLAGATPALGEQRQAVEEWLRIWTGGQTASSIGGVTVRLDHDATWNTFVVMLAPH